MDAANCAVCSIRSACDAGDRLYLYAPTPILSSRLQIVLQQNGLPFRLQDRTFALTDRCDDRETLLQTLLEELSEPEANDLRVTFDLTNLMMATSLTQAVHRSHTQWFEDALVQDRFTHWFQPIVDIGQHALVGHECLIRLEKPDQHGHYFNGQDIIDAAVTRGDLHIFDSYARRTAIRSAALHRTAGKVFINFTPSSIYDPAFCMGSTLQAMQQTPLQPCDIVFEVVESERVRDARHLRKIADYYRERGFSLALDDVGTGANSLQTLADMQPDFIKLDKSLIWNCESEIGRKTIRKLAELGADTGIQVIAEGVETAEMSEVLQECGVSLMQGYFFGRPSPSMLSQL